MVYIGLLTGGFLGGCLRQLVQLVLPRMELLPATLAINLTGSLALGVLLGLADRATWPAWLQIGVSGGLLGSFTTFSTLCVGVAALSSKHVLGALLFTLASFVLGPMMAFAGDWLVHAFQKEMPEAGEELSL